MPVVGSSHADSRWDYIIVGAGSAGCALAYQLADSANDLKVLVLEAGGRDNALAIRFAAAQVQAIAKHDWGYRSHPDPTRHGVAESWPRGRVVGGCSSINGTMYVRGAAEDFDRWARLTGDESWSAAHIMPIFSEIEASDQQGETRGRFGPLSVRTVRRPHRLTEAFVQAATACGYRFNDDYNDGTQEGVGYAQLSQRRGLRCSAADAFLKPLLKQGKLSIAVDAVVQRIEFCKRRADAVVYRSGGQDCRASAREFVLCAGAIDSPKLLMLSGIGGARDLERLGIDVVCDVPEVGRNLREHPLLKLVYRTRILSSNPTGGWRQRLGIVSKFLRTREGPISNLFEGAAFLRSSPAEHSPDIQLHFMTFGYSHDADGKAGLMSYPSATVLLNKSRPESTGRIRLASARAADAPLIECRLLEDSRDVETMVRGVRLVRKIMATRPMSELVDEEAVPGSHIVSVAQLEQYVRRRTEIAFHPVGTCRMGADPDAVVGPDLKVRGIDNLWIADASIMPDLISGNTNAACMMIGTKLGKQLRLR